MARRRKRNRTKEQARLENRRPWEGMLAEEDARERIQTKSPTAVTALDALRRVLEPYPETGWTVFNDWLDAAYRKVQSGTQFPSDIALPPVDTLRKVVFPAIR